ncbi:unannotated protein [freshwater metagenome]|uniref:Unannotated protein n=1 Tax=freshwater metagenome TaxID=449393 RepID=A0A6J6BV58_9ZZZZ
MSVQNAAHAVENARDCTRLVLDLVSDAVGLTLQFPESLTPAGVLFAIGARVARMFPHPTAQFFDVVGAFLGDGVGRVSAPFVFALEIGQFATNLGILAKITEVTIHRLGILGE